MRDATSVMVIPGYVGVICVVLAVRVSWLTLQLDTH